MKQKFFDIATELASQSTHHQHKLGCVIAKKNKVIGKGFNQLKTHTKSTNEYRMIHAELAAVLNAKGADLSDCDVYVVRMMKNGEKAISKPCKHCQILFRSLKVGNVYYTTDKGYGVIDA